MERLGQKRSDPAVRERLVVGCLGARSSDSGRGKVVGSTKPSSGKMDSGQSRKRTVVNNPIRVHGFLCDSSYCAPFPDRDYWFVTDQLVAGDYSV